MRILRISLKNFRGVGAIDAEFDPDGVTIVEGPNETGKTSLADAFALLLDSKDSSGKKAVKAVQPIGRDVGPFAEAELGVGPYRMVYRKRWLRERMTELEIVEPRAEQLSGEPAHNRVREIIEAETDRTLFDALRYRQGVEISQAAIASAPSLSAALDVAAGGEAQLGGGQAEALFEAVERERLRYFTRGGATTAARKERAADLDALVEVVEKEEEKIDKLEKAVERHQRIERELADLDDELPGVEERIAMHTKAAEEVEKTEHRLEVAAHRCELAEVELRERTGARDARAELKKAAEGAAKALVELEGEGDAASPELAAAKQKVVAAEEALAEVGSTVEAAEREAIARRELSELLDLSWRRDELGDRNDRVVAADGAIEDAERFLAGCTVDEGLVQEIEDAAAGLAGARGRAEAGKARLAIEALRPVRVAIDGEEQEATPGKAIETLVSAQVEVTIGDVARVVVSPPGETGDAEQELGRAERRLEELLQRAGATSPDEAHELLRKRSHQQSERDNANQSREAALRDLSPTELAAKLERAEERLAALQEGRDPVAVTPEAFDQARERVREAEAELDEARSRDGECRAGLGAAKSALRALETSEVERLTRIEGAAKEAERSVAELEERRAECSDEDLERAVREAGEGLAAATAEREGLAAELEADDPETVRATLENDRARKERLLADINSRRIELEGTRTEIEIGGSDGLSDRLADARAKLDQLQRDVESENERAAAVEHLHALLSKKREEAQQAYIGPFTNKVNAYSRILYGPEVTVAINHGDFTIASRTLNGTTVPFDSLSGGAREQLAVLSRLACGALVSPASGNGGPGGVPVIIDDALGYSDPDRLERLGAALSVAGNDCQVIVLTCEPGRYRGVGGAKVVPLT